MWIIKIIKIKCFYPPQILEDHWCIYSCLQSPPREKWFQFVRRVYTTAINFPCILTMDLAGFSKVSFFENCLFLFVVSPHTKFSCAFLAYKKQWINFQKYTLSFRSRIQGYSFKSSIAIFSLHCTIVVSRFLVLNALY